MKKIYIKPCLASMAIRINHSLLGASGSVTPPVVIPTTIIEDETADGNESLSRLNRDDWDDEEYEEEEEDF